MLKGKGFYKIGGIIAGLMLVIGIVLSGIGFAMGNGLDYLREEGPHQWYRIVYIDENNNLGLGVSFNGIGIAGHSEIPLGK